MWRASEVSYNIIKPWLLEKHYAQRIPSISYGYGLFKDDELKGVCTIEKPASPSLCRGICGEEYRDIVMSYIEKFPKQSPTEISRNLGVSRTTVYKYLNKLDKKG